MNPKEFREVGHQVVDLLAEYLEHIEDSPCSRMWNRAH